MRRAQKRGGPRDQCCPGIAWLVPTASERHSSRLVPIHPQKRAEKVIRSDAGKLTACREVAGFYKPCTLKSRLNDMRKEQAPEPLLTHRMKPRSRRLRHCTRIFTRQNPVDSAPANPAPAAAPDTRASRESPFASGRAGSSPLRQADNVTLFQWLTRMDGDCGFKGSAPAAALPGSGRWPAASPADRAAAHSRTAGPPRGRTPASDSSRHRPPHRPWFFGRSRAGP